MPRVLVVPNSSNTFSKLFATSTGNVEMNTSGGGSTSPITYFVTPSTAKAPLQVALTRINVEIIDGTITPPKFGGITALTNGCKIQTTTSTGGVLHDFTDGKQIKSNNQWALLSGGKNEVVAGAGDDGMTVQWALPIAFGRSVLLRQGEQFEIVVQDELNGLTEFRAMAQGVYVSG